MNHKISLIGLLSLFLLAACVNHQQMTITIDPQFTPTTSPSIAKKFAVTSIDQRKFQYVATVDTGVEKVTIIHTQQNLRQLIEDSVNNIFTSKGGHILSHKEKLLSSFFPSRGVEIRLLSAIAEIKQGSFDYEMNTKVIVQIIANNGTNKLTKTFNSTRSQSGSLKVSQAEIERNLNLALTKTLQDIDNNQKLHHFIQENF